MESSTMVPAKRQTSSMDSSFPVFLPEEPCLQMTPAEFEQHVHGSLPPTIASSASRRPATKEVTMQDAPNEASNDGGGQPSTGNTFVDALERTARGGSTDPVYDTAQLEAKNLTLTENQGVAFASTQSPLVDLFYHLDGSWNRPKVDKLTTLLESSWAEDPLATLKVIWSSRSIHLGKGERDIFYVALSWLSQHHPRTLLSNLQWIFRAVIEKDAKPREDDDKAVIEQVGASLDDQEVADGVSHGYWKDLLNLLVLSAAGSLDMGNPAKILLKRNVQMEDKPPLGPDTKKQKLYHDFYERERLKYKKERSQEDRLEETREYNRLQQQAAKNRKHSQEAAHHDAVLEKYASHPFHRALHLTVARLFAERLSKDMFLLQSTEPDQRAKGISLCAKWAPSLEGFHDKHTLIATTIAEILFPSDRIGEHDDSRERYLKRARQHYRNFTLSPLRKALRVVERDITAEAFGSIDYSRVPSLAMDKYSKLFQRKDFEGFKRYLQKVAQGKATISGAVLTPGWLVCQCKKNDGTLRGAVANAQWDALVQRIKDSGSLSDSIAVCDTSGSMQFPFDRHNTRPIDTAMGLSLVLSDVTKPPFGGKIITFSESPEILNLGGEEDKRSLRERVEALQQGSNWGMNTDFIKVFTNLILPIAVDNKVKREDMVKRIFVFSDMHFDSAAGNTADSWATHHQVIEEKFAAAGYDVPELVYWNLIDGDRSRPAPVTHDMPGTALVAGRNQALIKAFLDNGSFDQGGEDAEGGGDGGDAEGFEMVEEADTAETAEPKNKQKGAMTALSTMGKVIGHRAFEMLKVVD